MYNVDTIEWFRTSFKIDNSYFLNQNFLGKAIWILQSNLSKMTDLSFVENVNDELLDQVTIIPTTRRLLTIRLLWRRAGQSQGKSLSLSFGWCCVSDLITRRTLLGLEMLWMRGTSRKPIGWALADNFSLKANPPINSTQLDWVQMTILTKTSSHLKSTDGVKKS